MSPTPPFISPVLRVWYKTLFGFCIEWQANHRQMHHLQHYRFLCVCVCAHCVCGIILWLASFPVDRESKKREEKPKKPSDLNQVKSAISKNEDDEGVYSRVCVCVCVFFSIRVSHTHWLHRSWGRSRWQVTSFHAWYFSCERHWFLHLLHLLFSWVFLIRVCIYVGNSCPSLERCD